MPFREVLLKSAINTSEDDFSNDFFRPLLSQATRYDRAVGYFTSGWLRANAEGMAGFARNRGVARWITSPILDEGDWKAVQSGFRARADFDSVLEEIMERRLAELEEALERDTLSALAGMVSNGTIDFKLAVPTKSLTGGNFHSKMGVFTDERGDRVAFTGSYNDSIQGGRNYESLFVAWSWDPEHLPQVKAVEREFVRLWSGLDDNVDVYDVPSATRDRIVRLRPSRGQTEVVDSCPSPDEALERTGTGQPETKIELRDYQEQAVSAWFDNECRGLLEMATGTGKTITALAAARRRIDSGQRRVVLLVAPFSHLVDQWAREAQLFGFRAIQVGSSHRDWEQQLSLELRQFAKGRKDSVFVATTIGSLALPRFNRLLADLFEATLLIADEAHNMGARTMRAWLDEYGVRIADRIALSATPVRQFDDEGNEAIEAYFGGTVFEFGLEKAIGQFLTEYDYHPVPVPLKAEEFEEYAALSKRIAKLSGRDSDEPLRSDALKRLLIKRARVLNNSVSKLEWVQNEFPARAGVKHTLFYAGDKLFRPLMRHLGTDKGLRVHEFTGRQTLRERRDILERFEEGSLQALVAMKCLDEGVDVPPTRTAYFLASSGNSREFVQRRGRVLRRSPGKTHATIIDLISIPPVTTTSLSPGHPDFGPIQAAYRREYRRMTEFAGLARNGYSSIQPFFEVADKLGILGEV